MPPRIENPTSVTLAPEAVRVLQRIFAQYAKITIKKEFGSGLSGGRVFEVRPIRTDGTPELPTIVKLAPVSLIQQEWQAYGRHVQNRLPRTSQVTAQPVLLPKIGWGGLRYTMMGEGAFEVVSLGTSSKAYRPGISATCAIFCAASLRSRPPASPST